SGAGPTGQDQLTVLFKKSLVLDPSVSEPHTGLDPSGVRPPSPPNPELPIGPNGRVSFDGEAVVHVGDGTVWVSDEYGPYVYHYKLGGSLLHGIRPPEPSFRCARMRPGTWWRIFLPTTHRAAPSTLPTLAIHFQAGKTIRGSRAWP